MTSADGDRFELTPGQVAELIGVHRATIRRWAATGHLPSLVTPGGYRRFRRSDIDAFLDGRIDGDGDGEQVS
jgi:excisionase family DNA binding protein